MVAAGGELRWSAFFVTAGVFAMIYKLMPRVRIALARRLGRRGRHRGAVHRRQVPDRPVHRQERRHLGLRRRRLARGAARLGVLLGADLPDGRRVHLGLRRTASARRRPRSTRSRQSLRRGAAMTKPPPCKRECALLTPPYRGKQSRNSMTPSLQTPAGCVHRPLRWLSEVPAPTPDVVPLPTPAHPVPAPPPTPPEIIEPPLPGHEPVRDPIVPTDADAHSSKRRQQEPLH